MKLIYTGIFQNPIVKIDGNAPFIYSGEFEADEIASQILLAQGDWQVLKETKSKKGVEHD